MVEKKNTFLSDQIDIRNLNLLYTVEMYRDERKRRDCYQLHISKNGLRVHRKLRMCTSMDFMQLAVIPLDVSCNHHKVYQNRSGGQFGSECFQHYFAAQTAECCFYQIVTVASAQQTLTYTSKVKLPAKPM